jgi:hypothetical protein
MATTKSQAIETPSRPLIQIDDLVREMTEEELAAHEIPIFESPGPSE